ncbi:TPA: hypothetical protein DCX16_00290 [bacterium]|nr:hypothetical protein [bacterium]
MMEWHKRLAGWKDIKEGGLATIAILKFDVADSTSLRERFKEKAKDCIAKYHNLVEKTLTKFNVAPQPIVFQGDGGTVYFLGDEAVYNAVLAGKTLLSKNISVVPELIPLLQDSDWAVRFRAAEALWKLSLIFEG